MIARGEAFIAEGDVAPHGSSWSAPPRRVTLAPRWPGSTYDPNVLKGWAWSVFVRAGQSADMVERAVEFGSGEASQRLTALAQLAR